MIHRCIDGAVGGGRGRRGEGSGLGERGKRKNDTLGLVLYHLGFVLCPCGTQQKILEMVDGVLWRETEREEERERKGERERERCDHSPLASLIPSL